MEEHTIKGHLVDYDTLNKDSVIVDAGHCVGEFASPIREKFNCKIITIEPNPENYNKVPVDFEGALVGRTTDKELTFYRYHQTEWGNCFKLYDGIAEEFKVKTFTLDDIYKLTDHINLLKLDIEGAEKDLIETLTEDDAKKISQITMEVHKNCNNETLTKKLTDLGYQCSWRSNELYATK